jgi:uncharacterized membrane protein YoaK (UPF0700 family)
VSVERSSSYLGCAVIRKPLVGALLSFNGGFVDTAGFLGLQGLFAAHVTGNFVTLAATLAFGAHGAVAKLLVLPEFILVVALARVVGATLAGRDLPAFRILMVGKVLLLLAFFLLAVTLGPFPDTDVPAALLTSFAGMAAMAIQNAVHRVHLASLPPSTLMTGNTTQAVLDAIDLLRGAPVDQRPTLRARFHRTLGSIACFAAGCALAAGLYLWIGLWSLAVPFALGAVTAILQSRN